MGVNESFVPKKTLSSAYNLFLSLSVTLYSFLELGKKFFSSTFFKTLYSFLFCLLTNKQSRQIELLTVL